MKNEVHIGFRIPKDLDQRVDNLRDALSAKVAGLDITKSQLYRTLLERGLKSLEDELGVPRA
jgi:hypothetical protein